MKKLKGKLGELLMDSIDPYRNVKFLNNAGMYKSENYYNVLEEGDHYSFIEEDINDWFDENNSIIRDYRLLDYLHRYREEYKKLISDI